MRRRVELSDRIDAVGTLRRLTHYGAASGVRVADGVAHWAYRTEDGSVRLTYRQVADDAVEVEAFGPGAARGLEEAPLHLGRDDTSWRYETDHPVVGPLARRARGLRFGRTHRMVELLVSVIIGQKVTGAGASRSHRELVRAYGEPAPGPGPALWIAPPPSRLRELGYYDLHPFGIERKRARTILELTRRAARLERLVSAGADAADRRLRATRGVGPWTASIVRSVTFGDPDAVIVGDYNLPSLVSHALTGVRRADDARMLELLEPFTGHRGRVVWLLANGPGHPPRRGPRLPVRNIRDQ